MAFRGFPYHFPGSVDVSEPVSGQHAGEAVIEILRAFELIGNRHLAGFIEIAVQVIHLKSGEAARKAEGRFNTPES